MPNKKLNVLDVLDQDHGLVEPDEDGEGTDEGTPTRGKK
jgi:hypothetical protein